MPARIVGLLALTVIIAWAPLGAAQRLPLEPDPAPELTPNLGWIQADEPLLFADQLAGHVVLLDFWTYCCINCLHVLPDLEYLEQKYKDEPFVVIGVHSAKFEDEGRPENVHQAVEKYDIKHPVVVDDDMRIWRRYGVRAWPTFVLIGSDGNVIGHASGEGNRELLDEAIAMALDQGRERGDLAEIPLDWHPDEDETAGPGSATELRFPGKVLAVAPGDQIEQGALFIADSSHDRVIHATWPDNAGRAEIVTIYGNGSRGLTDGSAAEARFHDPQGFTLSHDGGTLYIADTKNHAVRAIDLGSRMVTTIAGTGEQTFDRVGGGIGTDQAISSPWALQLSRGGNTLYIAMAGRHQLWATTLHDGRTGAWVGSGRENIDDGPVRSATLAQPSGFSLSNDGQTLYFADSETSAIRAVDLREQRVRTIVGTGLFDFGDIDGPIASARLQHALGVATISPQQAVDGWRSPEPPSEDGTPAPPTADRLLVADTYNNKLKVLDLGAGTVTSWFDREVAGRRLDEPGGLSLASGYAFVADTNAHRIVRIDLATRAAVEINLEEPDAGLDHP
ncbi:MAG: thioredoxin-like domain-containing protein [Planctomycetota bacterium]